MFEELNVITQMFKGANVRRSLINPYGTTVLLESNGKNFVAQNLCTNYYSKSKGVTNTWDLFRVPVDEAEDIFHAMANFEWNTKIPQVQEMFKKAQPIALEDMYWQCIFKRYHSIIQPDGALKKFQPIN